MWVPAWALPVGVPSDDQSDKNQKGDTYQSSDKKKNKVDQGGWGQRLYSNFGVTIDINQFVGYDWGKNSWIMCEGEWPGAEVKTEMAIRKALAKGEEVRCVTHAKTILERKV